MDCFGTAISMSLQYGVPLKVYIEKFSHTQFEPRGHTKNPDIPIAKSLVDYIFRWLSQTFLPVEPFVRKVERLAELEGAEIERRRGRVSAENKRSSDAVLPPTVLTAPVLSPTNPEPVSMRNIGVIDSSVAESPERLRLETFTITTAGEQFEHFQSDAPLCDACGAITVRNGNCYLCHNCGKSMGCG